MNKIWVIGIAYDYGVCDRAGFFESEEEALRWIADEAKSQEEKFATQWEEWMCEEEMKDAIAYRARYLESIETYDEAIRMLDYCSQKASYKENLTLSFTEYYPIEISRGGGHGNSYSTT